MYSRLCRQVGQPHNAAVQFKRLQLEQCMEQGAHTPRISIRAFQATALYNCLVVNVGRSPCARSLLWVSG